MPAAKKKVLTVSAPLVQVKFGSRVLHFYRGDVLPEGVDADALSNLKSLGYVDEVDAPESDDK